MKMNGQFVIAVIVAFLVSVAVIAVLFVAGVMPERAVTSENQSREPKTSLVSPQELD